MTEQGNRWLLTRPDPMNGVLSRELTALGDAAWVHPLLCIEPLAEAASRLRGTFRGTFSLETCDIHQSARGGTLVSIARAAHR